MNQALKRLKKIMGILLFTMIVAGMSDVAFADSDYQRFKYLQNKIAQIKKELKGQNGIPFRQLWSALNNLLMQIDAIELTQEPQGDPVPQVSSGFIRLTKITKVAEDPRCIGESERFESGLDDGRGGGKAGNGILEPGEVDQKIYLSCKFSRPVAVAGDNMNIELNSLVTLDGTGSSDPAGESLTYFWAIVSQPEGSIAAVESPNSSITEFNADAVGTFKVRLVVSNGYVSSVADTVIIKAKDCTIDVDGDGEPDCYDTCTDVDGDGYGEGLGCSGFDCNDLNGNINPEELEECDKLDNNCNGDVDEGCACARIPESDACRHYNCGGVSDGCGGVFICGFCPTSLTCINNLCEDMN